MEKFIETNGKFLASTDLFPGVTPELMLARQRIGLYNQKPSIGTEMDLAAFLDQVRTLEKEINSQLVKMTEPIHIMMLGLLSGDNPFYLSLPGAAKTTMGRMLGSAVEGEFFRKNLNPDMSASDLFGPISLAGIQAKKQTREWAGAATATVAFVDEFYKGSSAIQNSLLDVAEERTVSDPHGTYPVPMLILLGASNEITGADARNAMWDRWSFRYELKYANRKDDIISTLSAQGGRKPLSVLLSKDEVLLCQALVEYMSLNLPGDIQNKMSEILVKLSEGDPNGNTPAIQPSPRRWMVWGRAFCAQTLLAGGQMKSESLLVGKDILWIEPEQREYVFKVIGGSSSPERAIIMSAQSDIEQIRNEANALITDTQNSQRMTLITQKVAYVKTMGEQIDRVLDSPEYKDDKAQLLLDLKDLRVELLEVMNKISQSTIAPVPTN